MDLKKYFTDEELNNIRPRIIRQFSSKDKLNDGFGVRDYNADNHWRDCDEEFSLLGKKTILILPGSGAQSAKQANGMCKIAEDLLPEAQKDKWQICSMHYEGDDMGKIPMVIRATDLLDNYLVPLFTTKDKEGDLHKIDAQTAAQNLRNVVIFAHCYGGYVVKEIERKMSELMTEIGYTDKERDNIMKQTIVIQHNNIDTNISEYHSKMTNLIRITQQDEKNGLDGYECGNLTHYISQQKLPSGIPTYIKLSANDRILLSSRITSDGIEEHGGYWVPPKYKTSMGKNEEIMFRQIFSEIVSSDYLIENLEQVIANLRKNDDTNKDIILGSIKEGIKFNDGYKQYKSDYLNFVEVKNKIEKDDYKSTDVLNLKPESLLMYDTNEQFILDDLLDKKDYTLAKIAFSRMEKNELNNNDDARPYFTAAIGRWIQKSIDDNQMDLFDKIMTTQSTFFANVTPNLWCLDYSNADNKALCKIIPQIYNAKTYPLQKEGYPENFSGCNFVKNLVTTYASIDKREPSEESQTAKKMLENILFKELSLEPEVKEAVLQKSEELGVTKLQRMAKNNWQETNMGNMLVTGGHERR